MSRKAAKSRIRGRKLRSTGTKTRTGRNRVSHAEPREKLKARARDLGKELQARERELPLAARRSRNK